MSAATMKFSPFQQAIFDHVEALKGNLIISAVAGSGKTTTLVEIVKRMKGSVIFLAFNKSIATELCERGVNAKTFHSLCFSAVMRFKKCNTVTTDKLRKIIDAKLSGDDQRMYGSFIARLVGLARNAGIGCLQDDVEQAWFDIVDHHDLDLDNEQADLTVAVKLARDLLRWSNESNLVDFDDLLYLCVKEGLVLPKFDNVLVDESQDTNPIQLAVLRKLAHKNTRFVFVGDENQAIYGFRGADSESMNNIRNEFNCDELPLSVSYRCAKNVVKYAQQWVPHMLPSDTASDGEVIDAGYNWKMADFNAGDMVICRTTAPLISLAYKFLRARKAVKILGKEIGAGLVSLIKKMNAKGIDALVNKLTAYRDREVEKAMAKKQEAKAEAVRDKVDSILVLVEGLVETDRTIPALIKVIEGMFDDVKNATILCTGHKSKGLEADTVYWLNRSKCPSSWASREWQKQAELNVCYVIATRSKKKLVLIEEQKDQQPN